MNRERSTGIRMMAAIAASMGGVSLRPQHIRVPGDGTKRAYALFVQHAKRSRDMAGTCKPAAMNRMKSSRPSGVSNRQWKRARSASRRAAKAVARG